MLRFPLLIVMALLPSAGCMSLRPALRQSGPAAEALTRDWHKEILKRGRDGDWLVIRGYNSTGQLVAVAGIAELSHVGILDASRGEVIEAVSPEVSALSLRAFLEDADRVLLIRPSGADRESGRRALARARSQIGAPYDLLGTVGLPEQGKFYCSELAAWSIGIEVDRDGPADVLHPAQMSQFGAVLFDSDVGISRAPGASRRSR
ncbi:MAG: hypothetical protein HY290_14540 [Planctomycetia bacterium]|nr:hypothetical protein [Planctomycetia bacterium]